MGINLSLSDEELQSYEQDIKDSKKPTIPQGSLVRALVYDVSPSQAAAARAAQEHREPGVLDGFVMRLAALGYYRTADSNIVTVIDVSNPDVIVFPHGTDLNPKMYYNLNTTALNFAGYVTPKEDKICRQLYNQLIERDLGIPHGTLKIVDGVVEPLVCHFYRYIDSYWRKSDMLEDKVTPKPGAVKQIKSVLTTTNRETKKQIVVPVEPFDALLAAKVYEAIETTFPAKTVKTGKDKDLPF